MPVWRKIYLPWVRSTSTVKCDFPNQTVIGSSWVLASREVVGILGGLWDSPRLSQGMTSALRPGLSSASSPL